jgi:ABC-type sugar transport system ATPase subunit
MSGGSATSAVLELRGAWKSFGHVIALKGVNFAARPGEVVAVVGDNGAGKSTLIKVLSGVYRLDRGELRVAGKDVTRSAPKVLRQLGVSTVFQDLALVETLDVATNMFLGSALTRARWFTNRAAMYQRAASTLQQLKVQVPSVRVPVGELSGGQRQSVAIARAVLHNSATVIMDEPTAALGVRETMQVGSIIEELKAQGRAVVLVSHDLEFVLRHADLLHVMRLGTTRGRLRRDATDREEVVGLITGLISTDPAPEGSTVA